MATKSEMNEEQADDLRQLADRARRLASVLPEPDRSRVLSYVEELETQAVQLVSTAT